MKLRHLLLACTLAVPGVAMAAQCDADLEKAGAALADGRKETVTADDFEAARLLVADATALLSAGDDVGCVATVGQALELLGVADSE